MISEAIGVTKSFFQDRDRSGIHRSILLLHRRHRIEMVGVLPRSTILVVLQPLQKAVEACGKSGTHERRNPVYPVTVGKVAADDMRCERAGWVEGA